MVSDRLCPICGSTNIQSRYSSKGNYFVCSHCGANFWPSAHACKDAERTCLKCGAKMPPDAKYCGFCGAPFSISESKFFPIWELLEPGAYFEYVDVFKENTKPHIYREVLNVKNGIIEFREKILGILLKGIQHYFYVGYDRKYRVPSSERLSGKRIFEAPCMFEDLVPVDYYFNQWIDHRVIDIGDIIVIRGQLHMGVVSSIRNEEGRSFYIVEAQSQEPDFSKYIYYYDTKTGLLWKIIGERSSGDYSVSFFR